MATDACIQQQTDDRVMVTETMNLGFYQVVYSVYFYWETVVQIKFTFAIRQQPSLLLKSIFILFKMSGFVF